jgi:hypothetical protein
MSDEMIFDLSNYKDKLGSRVPPATYRVQVEDVEATESAAKNPMINLWFTILDGEFQGQTLTDRLVLTEKSLFRVVGFMQAIGLPTPKKKLKVNIRQFVGRVLDVEVSDGEPYNGRIRSEVRGYIKVAKSETAVDLPDDDVADPESSEAASEDVALATETPATEETVATDASDDLDLETVEL